MTKICEVCGEERHKKYLRYLEVYDNPWDDVPREIFVCKDNEGLQKSDPELTSQIFTTSCYERLFDTGWSDFRYFLCDTCERIVSRQCHSNGWHSYVRYIAAWGAEICLSCYEQELFENGLNNIGVEELESGFLPGMFLDTIDLKKHGFVLVEEAFVRSNGEEIIQQVLSMMDTHHVIINYDHLSMCGDEGFIEIWTREKCKTTSDS